MKHQKYQTVNLLFTVYGSNGSFYWQVQAERHKIDVEPNINDYIVQCDGPYTYIIPK